MEPAILKPRVRIAIGILVLAYVLSIQLIGIQRPFVGHYATYQGTVMASMAKNMARENFSDIFMTKTDTILEGQRSLHLNQYPFPSLLTAAAVKSLGGSYELWGRLQAISFNLFAIFLVFAIGKRFFDEQIALIGTAIFALSPLTVIYGQSFMSEPSSLFLFLASFYFLIRRDQCSLLSVLLSSILFSLAITGRLHWILFLPVFCIPIWWAGSHQRIRKLLMFCGVAVLFPVMWYAHTYFASLQAPHVHTSLFLQMATSEKGVGFWFQPDLYRAVGLIFGKSMLALLMAPFFLLGIVPAMRTRGGRFCLLVTAGITLALMLLAPGKLIRHDFYLYACFPFVAFITALGVEKFLEYFKTKASFLAVLLLFFFLVASAVFSSRSIFTAPEEEKNMLGVAEQVREKTAPDDSLIVGGENVGIFAFYTDRPYWTLTPSAVGKPLRPYLRMTDFTGRDEASLQKLENARQDPVDWLEYLRSQGADYFVVPRPANFQSFPEFLQYLNTAYDNVSNAPEEYLLYDLSGTRNRLSDFPSDTEEASAR